MTTAVLVSSRWQAAISIFSMAEPVMSQGSMLAWHIKVKQMRHLVVV